MVGFHGDSVQELRNAFEKLNRAPQKPYSGKLSLRLEPELHASVALQAELAHKSINQWVADVLSREAHHA